MVYRGPKREAYQKDPPHPAGPERQSVKGGPLKEAWLVNRGQEGSHQHPIQMEKDGKVQTAQKNTGKSSEKV